jgi:hypothetical protein
MGRVDGDVTITMGAVEEVSPGIFHATMRYTYGDDKLWTQSFSSKRLTDDDLAADLVTVRLRFDRFLTEDRTWP